MNIRFDGAEKIYENTVLIKRLVPRTAAPFLRIKPSSLDLGGK
ncbi:hypothetical protein [Methylobacterium sp. WL64]|nr:hypothetical protein [Methylobacterium sp. WL64]